MNDPSTARKLTVGPSDAEAVTLPADLAGTLGRDVTVTVGPDRSVTLRPVGPAGRKRTQAELLAACGGSRPVADATTLMHASAPLTAEERAALQAFLSEG